jgi:hypothetical protein
MPGQHFDKCDARVAFGQRTGAGIIKHAGLLSEPILFADPFHGDHSGRGC